MNRAQLAERMSRYRRRLRSGHPPVVSEGDSWFDYPLFLNVIDRIDDRGLFAHLRLEKSGDTVAGMIGTASRIRALAEVVAEEQPLCVLFSGGGNDFADAAPGLFRLADSHVAADCIVEPAFAELLAGMEAAYRAMVGKVGPLAPIFAHGYDYFQPSKRAVKFFIADVAGPWSHPAMETAGIEEPLLQREIARILIDRFNQMLADLQADNPDNFVYIDLRGTLDIDRDWQNEIHPTRRGFGKVAGAYLGVVTQQLPALQERRLRGVFA